MGITIKKKQLTIKKQIGEKDDAPVSDASETNPGTVETQAPETTAPELGIPTAAPPMAASPAVKPTSYMLAGILAIIAVVMFITLIILQSFEWDFFSDAFPRPQPPGAAPAQRAVSPTAPRPLAPQPLDALDE